MSDLNYHRPNEKSHMEDFQAQQILALRIENQRLENELKGLRRFKKFVPVLGKTDLNNPVFHKPISVVEY